MLPGKRYTPEEILGILRRRLWLLLVPFAIVSAGTAAGARMMPDRYRSDTLILVVPQRVPENYVKSTVTTRIEDRLQSITQQILSRTRLERIIQDFNLYAKERRTGIMEDIVEAMRKDIHIQVVKGDAFRVGFVGTDPRMVARVTERLASLFIEENLRDREVLAEGTNQFLEAQLEESRRRLVDQEKKLETYRKQYAGELPSQLDSNLEVMRGTEMQIQATVESVNRDRDRRLMIEQAIAQLEPRSDGSEGPGVPDVVGPEGPIAGGTAAQQLGNAKMMLAAMQLRLKPGHPDIQRMNRVIRDLEKKADEEALNAPMSGAAVARKMSPEELQRVTRLNDLRSGLDQLDRQIAFKIGEERRLRALVGTYRARVEAAPTRESELAELTRDYETLQEMYTNLLTKKEESKIAANLERRQIGEQFKLLDPARIPERPFSPNRRQINMLGLVLGLAVGLGLIGLLEYQDSSFKSDEEVVTILALPVLAVVPFMQSTAERRRALRRRVLIGFGLGTTVATCLALVVYTFVR